MAGLNRITAAYNFAPLSPQVVTPDWASQVSHDLPLRDGLCAEIEVELLTHTPFLIGGERTPSSKGVNRVDFVQAPGRNPDAAPYVPGSTLRGAVRNVLEIATFGRMELIDDKALSVRDLDSPAYRTRMSSGDANRGYVPLARGGWLRFSETEGWQIREVDVYRIEHEDLEYLELDPGKGERARHQMFKAFKTAEDKDYARTAKCKYEALKLQDGERFDFIGEVGASEHKHSKDRAGKPKLLVYRKAWFADAHGQLPPTRTHRFRGALVMTGQPGYMDEPGEQHKSGSKHMEFVFSDDTARTVWAVDAPTMTRFRQVHEHSADLQYLQSARSPHLAHGIPVFFVGSSGRVDNLGLAQIFRLPGAKSLKALAQAQQNGKAGPGADPDFVSTLFGQAEESNPLKGRVSFGDAQWVPAQQSPAPRVDEAIAKVETVLGQPRPSFYPNYLVQPAAPDGPFKSPRDEFETVLSASAKLRGWKRYPVRPAAQVQLVKPPALEQKSNSVLRPLQAGSRFRAWIRLHNVTRVEAGAVVWALTWGGREDLRHSIGMGKAFGMGQVSFRICGHRICANDASAASVDLTPESLMHEFTAYMASQVPRWAQTASITELLAMANPTLPQANNQNLAPMRLEISGVNEFQAVKKRPKLGAETDQRRSLVPYSKQRP